MINHENTAKIKSKKLAIEIIALYRELTENKNEFVLSNNF